MSRQPSRRTDGLTVDAIVDAALALVQDSGLATLSMRRLGGALGVDPMAVYHHVPNKRELLSLMTARVVGTMSLPATDDPWDVRVRGWAHAYWDVVVAHRDLIAAGLADPIVAAGAMLQVIALMGAVADSGIDHDRVEANVWLIVDFVHGAGLGAGAPLRHDHDDLEPLRRAFDAGLDTIVAGLVATVRSNASGERRRPVTPPRRSSRKTPR